MKKRRFCDYDGTKQFHKSGERVTPMSKTSIPSGITEGQKVKFRRLIEDALKAAIDLAVKKVKADEAGWQKVLEHGDNLHRAIVKAVILKTRRLTMSDMTPLFDETSDPFEEAGISRT